MSQLQPARKIIAGGENCWHCEGLGVCDCIHCGHYAPDEGWTFGECVVHRAERLKTGLFARAA